MAHPPDGLDRCLEALRREPGRADLRRHCAGLLQAAGQVQEAVAQLRQAATLGDGLGETLGQLGVLLAEQGHLAEALEHLGKAVHLAPGDARSRHNLGVALAQSGRADEGIPQLEEALRLEPGYAEAAYNLGHLLGGLGRRDEAVAAYRRALASRPEHYGALNNLGLALQEARQPGEAVILLRQATRLRPEAPEAHDNLGLALADLGRFDQAEQSYHEALRLNPRYAEAHTNLGSTLKELGRTEEAVACFAMALRFDPSSRSARYNRSLTLLQAGDWAAGWKEYEHRFGRKNLAERAYPRPRWDGSSLQGKTVLAWAEQGMGDTIQFLRYARPLKEQGARVLVECPGILVPLVCTCPAIDTVVAEGEPLPPFDVHVPLLSLPGHFGTTPDDVPVSIPYLAAEPDRLDRWRRELGEGNRLRVGIVWQGNPHFEWDRFRSAPLAAFAPLAGIEGVELVSLQKGAGEAQLGRLRGRFPVRDLGPAFDAEGGFRDAAAVLRCLDLLVCVDTAVGHLAGALGVPTWLALSTVADWRWLRGRADTPWYPAHRLFRQQALGDWGGVFTRVAGELGRLVRRRRRGSARVEVSAGELLDRLSILRIKARKIADPEKVRHVEAERAALEWACREQLPASPGTADRLARLEGVNERLWEVEDALRACERGGDFGAGFVELARSVYSLNDERAALKLELNRLLGAPWSDPKSYPPAP